MGLHPNFPTSPYELAARGLRFRVRGSERVEKYEPKSFGALTAIFTDYK